MSHGFRVNQAKSESVSEFSARTTALAARLEIRVVDLPSLLGISEDTLMGCRTGRYAVSKKTWAKLEALERTAAENDRLKSGGKPAALTEGPQSTFGRVASRIPLSRQPSTRTDCEAYVQQLFDAADLSDNPNAFPVIHDRLRKIFPLEEWEPEKKE